MASSSAPFIFIGDNLQRYIDSVTDGDHQLQATRSPHFGNNGLNLLYRHAVAVVALQKT
jgi:hypothetical protein